MTETRTSRLQLPQWSSGTGDSPSRDDFNEAFFNLENWAGRWESGALVDRRAAGIAGAYYTDELGTIYRDNGSTWVTIGAPRNTLAMTKESGTEPVIKLTVPAGMTTDAFRTVHGAATRFAITSSGDVVASSTRLYQSAAAAPASTLPHTVAIASKSGASSGATVYGAAGQGANLIETKTQAGADLTQLTASGDVFTVGRSSTGSLTPAESQVFVKGSQESRPVLLLRGANNLPNTGPILQAQNADGGTTLLRLDGAGRMALGSRGNQQQLFADLLALNTNYTTTNNGGGAIAQGKLVFRNTLNGYGVAGIELRQEPGDGPGGGSLGIFAGAAAADSESAERVRFGISSELTGARFTSSDPQWTPMVVRGTAGQTANLLKVQRGDGTTVVGINKDGDITARSLVVTSTDTNQFPGDIIGSKRAQGQTLRAIEGDGSVGVGVLSQITATRDNGYHFLAQDQTGKAKARINRDGTLEIGCDTAAVNAGATLLTMRGQAYRQNGRKLQSYDADAGRWGSFESAFASEYYSTTSQNVKNNWTSINWGGETNDSENAFYNLNGTPGVQVPFTGWYDVRALSHVTMNFTGSGSATFKINGALEMKYRRDFPRALGFDVCTLSLNDLVYLNRNDVLEVAIAIDSIFFTVTTLNSGNYRSRMSIRFAGNA